MNKWIGLALFLAVALLFFIANRGAYEGFFQGDELDSLSWTPQIPIAVFVEGSGQPGLQCAEFPAGGPPLFPHHEPRLRPGFPDYVLPLHLLHLLNVWLLWMVLRSMGASPFAAGAGALFFAFNMAVFDVYWKPMYAFDLFCGAFCLLSLLFWIKRRWVLSFSGVLAGIQIERTGRDAAGCAGQLRAVVRQAAMAAADPVFPGIALVRAARHLQESQP